MKRIDFMFFTNKNYFVKNISLSFNFSVVYLWINNLKKREEKCS